MSILQTLNTGATGLQSNGEALGVVSDNIANANTIGFKRSRANFQDMVATASKSQTSQIGGGSHIGSIQAMWSQGAMLSTGSSTDLALSGDGFFVVNGTASGVTGNFYTRAGQFKLDKEGYVTNVDGLKLQGYPADGRGQIMGTLGDLRIGPTSLPASATTAIKLGVNLDSSTKVPALAFDPLNAAATSNFSGPVTLYDSLGNAHQTTVYFAKTAEGAFDWHATVDGGDITGGTAGTPVEGASGQLTFGTNGELLTSSTTASSWNFAGATQAQAISFDFGTSVAAGGSGLDGTTSNASASNVSSTTQDGFAAGAVTGINISPTGMISGSFTNGQRRVLGQVAVANFKSDDGLQRASQGLFAQTEESGEALMGTASTGGRGAIASGSLEQSNVDMGAEFVDLISFQRGFSANAKVIQTADQMYGELVDLKR